MPTTPLRGLTVLLTGATDGIGAHTAMRLARDGALVVAHGRDPAKVARTLAEVRDAGGQAEGILADLSSLAEVARLAAETAERFPTLDVLINNAGVGFGADMRRREVSRDGHELRFAVNYLAPYLLTEELLARGLPRRAVVHVASIGQEAVDLDDLMVENSYNGMSAYRRSKLAMIMHAFDVAAAHPGTAANALHPGTLLDTKMVREPGIPPRGPASRGSDATVAVLLASLAGTTGAYFDDDKPDEPEPPARDPAARAALRAKTEALVRTHRLTAAPASRG